MTKVIVSITALIFSMTQLWAQTPPTPPTPPEKTSTGVSYSISINGDDDGTKYSNTSVSIKKTDDIYKLTASFNKNRTQEVREALLENLGKKGLTIKGSSYTWIKNKNGDEVFECKLTKGRLRIFLDRNAVSTSAYEEMVTMGVDLKDLIAGSDSEEEAKKDLERAEKDLERAKRDLERAEKELKKAKKQ
ncbi:MAG: hypothetical protein KTR22_05380 [Flavobacteriaceae bacterium]|nr:hypothetical protein [Flavobacteriaceae bacterium]